MAAPFRPTIQSDAVLRRGDFIAPVIQEIAQDYAGKLKVLKMNVDDNPRTPSRYGVRGIPNLIIFHGGQVKEQIVGAVPKAQLVKAIDQVVNGHA